MQKDNPSRLALGSALLLLGLILFVNQAREPSVYSNTFAEEPVKIEGFSDGNNQDEKIPRRVIVPNLKIDLDVEKSRVVDGYWQVFDDKAGWGEGSGLPGEKGNQVIFAHAREGLFLQLQLIKPEDKVYVLAQSNWFEYKVSEIKKVNPNEIEVIAPSEEELLTLYTCSGFKDAKRLIVRAKRI